MQKRVLFTLSFFIFAMCLFGQKNIEFLPENFPGKEEALRDAVINIEDGDYYFIKGAYDIALEHYLKAQKFNGSNSFLNYKIGRTYMHTIYKKKAVEYIEFAFKLNPELEVDREYHLGMAYQMNYEFDKAIVQYKLFRKRLSPKELEFFGPRIEKRINECNTGIKLMQSPKRVYIENLGPSVNSKYPDYSPIINADESVLFFTSRRENTTGGMQDPEFPGYYEDIYISYNVNGKWTEPYNPGKPLNTNFHDAIVGLSPDGHQLFVYRGDKGGGIYVCKLEGMEWSKPELLEKPINTRNHEPSASFSYDMRTIYFVSDREGGYGGKDIYVCYMDDNGEWGEAENLGPAVNTPYEEDGVFMHPDNKTLYFSSKGHNTMGGYDIFKSVYENGKWNTPENMGHPINTPDDDVFFSMSASGEHGYFSSIRPGGIGNHDIYRINFFGPEKPVINNNEDNLIASAAAPVTESVIEPIIEINSVQLTLLKGLILDEETGKPVKAEIELVDNEKNKTIATFFSNSSSGKYLVSLPSGKNYGIAVKAEGYLFHSENFNIPKLTEFRVVEKEIRLKRIEVGKEIALRNIFFDYKKAELRQESITELDRLAKLLNENPTLKLEISGHTDNIGTAEYNKELSLKRANAVVSYLVEKKGIEKSRLTSIGYGFEKPIATNETDEGRQQNRRSEFKIIEK